jgi:hypothetical protein
VRLIVEFTLETLTKFNPSFDTFRTTVQKSQDLKPNITLLPLASLGIAASNGSHPPPHTQQYHPLLNPIPISSQAMALGQHSLQDEGEEEEGALRVISRSGR